MGRNIFLFALSVLFLWSCGGPSKGQKTGVSNDQNIYQDVAMLASDEMEGRETGTKGEIIAANYIVQRMKEIGLQPAGGGDSYIQYYDRRVKAHPHAEPKETDPVIKGRNVLGIIDNNADKTVVIGAHYDHLGYGGEGSLHTGAPAIHNGADDNASGVAAMLDLAAYLMDMGPETQNYLFIGFSGEEKGLWGSNYYAKNPTINLNSVNYMINMDMVGRLKESRDVALYGVGTAAEWGEIMESIESPTFNFKIDSSGVGPSDHTSFYLEDVPVLHFFTGQHEDYHKPTDDVEFINFKGIEEIALYISKVIHKTSEMNALTFQKTKSKNTNTRRSFKVTLGVMPDYLYDGKGMKIDAVKEDRPASNAGIKDGDTVVKMGEIEIPNMMAYMKALSKFAEGQTIKVIVERDGEKVEKMVTF